MDKLIDDFTSGPLTVELTDTSSTHAGTQKGDMLGGSRRTTLTLDVARNHGQPLILDLGRPLAADGELAGLNLTTPVDAPATVNLVYGDEGGVREDWSQASALLVDIAGYTSFLPTTYAIVLFSDDGKRSRWNATFVAPPKQQVLRLAFSDLQPDEPGKGVDLTRVRVAQFVFVFNGSARIRSFRVV